MTPLTGLLAFALLAPPPAVHRGGELRFAVQAEPRSADPQIAADEPSELLAYLTHAVLVRVNRYTQQPTPDLAQSWKAAPDGKSIVFTLRPGIKFSDGTPVTSADVCFSLARILDPKLDAANGESLRSVAGAVRCSPAAARVTLTFDKPLAAAERWFDGIAILPASGKEKTGAGPFQIREWQPGAFIALQRNAFYWRHDSSGAPLPYLDGVRLEVQRNRDLEMLRFEKDELQVVLNLDPDLYNRLRAKGAVTPISLGVSFDSEQMWFNQSPAAPIADSKKALFRSTHFRQAVSTAIHRDDLARVVYHGHASPAAGPVSPANRFWANASLKPASANPAAALALLRRDGFTFAGNVLKDPQGRPVEFSIITNAGNKSRERMAAMIQQDLAAIGIQVRVAPLDFPSLIERLTKTFDYDACMLGLVASDLDPNNYMSVWLSSAANHQWNPKQPKPATPWEAEIDKLMQAQALAMDPAVRKRAYDRVQAIVADQLPFIYLIHRSALVGISPHLHGTKPALLRPQVLWNVEQLWLDPR